MMQQRVAVFTTSNELFQTIAKTIRPTSVQIQQVVRDDGDFGSGLTLAFVDGKWEGDIALLLEKLAARAVYTVLVDDEKHIGDSVPEYLSQGLVDDLLIIPIRPLELLGKLKHVMHLARVNDVVSVNSDLKTLIEKFEEDLRTTRAIQKSLIPEKFNQVQGFKVTHKYLSGMKSGGDYLDFFEFEDKTHVGILMSDSSAYGLSSAFMSVILRLAVKLSQDEVRSPSKTVERIFEELKVTMKPTEHLSIFYGILNRKTFELTYVSSGNIHFIHHAAENNGASIRFKDLSLKNEPLAPGRSFELNDQKVLLLPEDRVVVLTDGFSETFDNPKKLEESFSKAYGDDAIELINTLTYQIKKQFESEDDMPAQDCSVMVIDVEKRAMRLAK